MRKIQSTLVAALLTLLVPAPAEAAVCDELGVCVEGGDWETGETLDDKARAKERKKHRKSKKQGTLTVELGKGSGSVFVDGVWIGVAPISYMPLAPGKHDIEVRSGETLLARGVLTVPKKGGDVKLQVPG